MKMCSSGFAPRRRQGGFIQGAILFALVIIAVVVAAFSLANRDSQSNADSEQARVNASFLLKVGNDIQSGISRAVADGFPPANLGTGIIFNKDPSTETEINLFDTSLRYVSRPQFPPTALATASTTQPFMGTDNEGTLATASMTLAAVTGVGNTLEREAIVLVPGLKDDVCKRINVTANGAIVTAPIPSDEPGTGDVAAWREGCFNDGTVNVYFRVVATDAAPAA